METRFAICSRTAAIWLTAGFAAAVFVSCGGRSGAAAPGADDLARLASVTVGSDTVLGPADTSAANVIGLDLVTLAVPLRTWWATLNDPDVAERVWLERAPQLLAEMRATVSDIERQLGPGRDGAVRATFTPYLQRWREILGVLDAMRAALAVGDVGAQQRAVDAYNDTLAAVRRLDRQRVARVLAVYGRDEATRVLAAQGLDLASFGL